MRLDTIEVVTLFVENIDDAKAFYQKVFTPEVVYQDDVSSVLKFSGAMINLLRATEASNWSSHRQWQRLVGARAFCSRSRSTTSMQCARSCAASV